MVHARVSSGPAVKKEIRPSSRVAQADHALEADSVSAHVLAENGRLVIVELADLHLDLGAQGGSTCVWAWR